MASPDEEIVGSFLDYIYGHETGYCYIAVKTPGNQHAFKQYFFEWPNQRPEIVEFILDQRHEREVYFAPALFNKASAKKEDVKGAQVVWVEFDGKEPLEVTAVPEPTFKVRSSGEGHAHWYWRLDRYLGTEELERINRALTYLLESDTSGWDASQILRPPSTLNHKRGKTVEVIASHDIRLDPALFDGLPEPPPPVEEPTPERIPQVETVVAKYQWPDGAFSLFRAAKIAQGSRSSALMSLGFYCAEMNMATEDFLAILMNADQRWGKFYGRSDRMRRLMEIVTRARQKYPYKPTGRARDGEPLEVLGFRTVLHSNIELTWAWEGLLHTEGYMLMTGPSGVGKTQLSLDVGTSMVLGRTALERPVRQGKIGFFSLEMGIPDLKYFLKLQASSYSQEELEQLEDGFKILGFGEPLALNRKDERERIEQAISDHGFNGIIVDSLGSATEDDLSDEAIKRLMLWNDELRSKMGIWTWFIHHHRKATSENKKPNKLADVYGSMFITRNATSVISLWESSVTNAVEVNPLKTRLSKKPSKFNIMRGEDLHFKVVSSGVSNSDKPKESEGDNDEKKSEGEVDKTQEITPSGTSVKTKNMDFG